MPARVRVLCILPGQVVYSGEQVPLEVTVSDSAMAGGAAKVAEAAVEAAKKAQAEAQKTMQVHRRKPRGVFFKRIL